MGTPKTTADQNWSLRPLYAGVLVGGSSTRMGQAKALLRHEGTSFGERVINVVQKRAGRVILLGDGPVPAVAWEITRVADAPGIGGPLAGICAALRWAPDACWIIVACDLPLLRIEALDWLLGQRRPDRPAILPRIRAGRAEPLLSIYEPESLPLIEQLVARGSRSPRRLADEPTVYTPTPPDSLRDCWTNVNTPEELRRLERDAADDQPEGSHPD